MIDEELQKFDVISYKIKDGKQGAIIVHNIKPITHLKAEKMRYDLIRRQHKSKMSYGIIEIRPAEIFPDD